MGGDSVGSGVVVLEVVVELLLVLLVVTMGAGVPMIAGSHVPLVPLLLGWLMLTLVTTCGWHLGVHPGDVDVCLGDVQPCAMLPLWPWGLLIVAFGNGRVGKVRPSATSATELILSSLSEGA